ncbi:MAG: hypothetical protein IKL29_10330, partial [Bacteroidaceae bacterium]|nr:hypothetical protein [Bacteroidaceae bacterium]
KKMEKNEKKSNLWRVAQQMMIVAIFVGSLMLPAQSSAENVRRGEGKSRTAMIQKKNDKKPDKKKNDKKFKNNKQDKKAKGFVEKKKGGVKHKKHSHKPKVVVKHHNHKHVVHHHPTVVHHNCNGAAEAIGTVIGLAALVALLAN